MSNIILNTDSYKPSHYLQYPPDTKYCSAYIESRGGKYEETQFCGLQMFIKRYLLNPITHADIAEAEDILLSHGVPFYRAGWEYIQHQHDGYLPLNISAVPEGMMVPTGNVLVQVVNTDPLCAWLPSYIETPLLRSVWYPTTVATVSKKCKDLIAQYLELTANDMSGLPFKLHDFGARGATSEESTSIGALAHLINFKGTDSLSGILAARRYYSSTMAGFSIPAAEHSTITSWGRDNEARAYDNMLNKFGGVGNILAVVSDSYDIWNAIDNIWGGELREKVIGNGGTLVIRPDSGSPLEIVPKVILKLMDKFGFTYNTKGYKVLPPYLRVIQGDGVNIDSIGAILRELTMLKISTDNIAFGMGGELLQKVDRDTQRFAMKTSAVCVGGQWSDVYKDPITDSGKRSKRGVLALVKDSDGTIKTIRDNELAGRQNILEPVYRNGLLLREYTLEDIRAISNIS